MLTSPSLHWPSPTTPVEGHHFERMMGYSPSPAVPAPVSPVKGHRFERMMGYASSAVAPAALPQATSVAYDYGSPSRAASTAVYPSRASSGSAAGSASPAGNDRPGRKHAVLSRTCPLPPGSIKPLPLLHGSRRSASKPTSTGTDMSMGSPMDQDLFSSPTRNNASAPLVPGFCDPFVFMHHLDKREATALPTTSRASPFGCFDSATAGISGLDRLYPCVERCGARFDADDALISHLKTCYKAQHLAQQQGLLPAWVPSPTKSSLGSDPSSDSGHITSLSPVEQLTRVVIIRLIDLNDIARIDFKNQPKPFTFFHPTHRPQAGKEYVPYPIYVSACSSASRGSQTAVTLAGATSARYDDLRKDTTPGRSLMTRKARQERSELFRSVARRCSSSPRKVLAGSAYDSAEPFYDPSGLVSLPKEDWQERTPDNSSSYRVVKPGAIMSGFGGDMPRIL